MLVVVKQYGRSIENFDPYSARKPILDSPRSIEACRRQGIEPAELLVKKLEEIKAMFSGEILDRKALEIRLQHYEEKRREKVRLLLEVENTMKGFFEQNQEVVPNDRKELN